MTHWPGAHQHAPIERFDVLAPPQWIKLFGLEAPHPLGLGRLGVNLVRFLPRFELGLGRLAETIAGPCIRSFFRFVLPFLGAQHGQSAKQNH